MLEQSPLNNRGRKKKNEDKMKTGCLLMFVVGLVVSYVGALGTPKYLKACSMSDPRINECAKQNGQAAIPFLADGDREYRIPNMKPLNIPSVSLQPSGNLKITFTNCKVYGLDKAQLTEMKLDPKGQKASIILHIDDVWMDADYDVNGQLLILPIQGKGPSKIRFVGGDFFFDFDWSFVEKRGTKFAKIENYKLRYQTQRSYYRLENLFNGDKVLGEQTNKFLDENWKDIDKDLGPAISETIAQICVQIASSLFDRIPYNQLFLP